MSILIKGMEMPKTCLECWNCDRNFRDEEGEPIKDWMCLLLFEQVGDSTKTRLNGCPLIELPDHGDLVDRDALMMKMWEASAYAPNHCSWVNARVVFVRDIEDAPVVIQAERSEE